MTKAGQLEPAGQLAAANPRWLGLVPRALRSRLDGRHGLQAAIGNSGWLMADKVVRMGIGLLVGIWVVRYLGPTQLGMLNYASAFATLFGALAALGLDRVVVQELVRNPARRDEILGTAFVLKLVAGIASVAMAALAIFFVRGGDTLVLAITCICAFAFVFQSLNVVDFFFQSRVQARYVVFALNGAFLLATLAKIGLLLVAAPLIAFAWNGLAEAALAALFLVVAYRVAGLDARAWRFSLRLARELLRYSWPLILSSVAIVIYMRMDQIMIGQMLGDHEVGLFSAAVRISEIWYFIPSAIVSSVVPAVMRSREKGEAIYHARLEALLSFLVWLGIAVAVAVTIARHSIVGVLFGQSYAGSADVLAIHVWGGVFVAIGVASGIWYTVENLQKLSFYRTLCGVALNLSLNLILIPSMGINGAAIATIVSQVFAAFLFDLLNPRTRPMFWIKARSFNPMAMFRATTGDS